MFINILDISESESRELVYQFYMKFLKCLNIQWVERFKYYRVVAIIVMADSNAFLVKPKENIWSIIQKHFNFDSPGVSHQIYAPGKFILGHFKEEKDDFILSPGGIFYRDSPEDLQKYQRGIDEGKLETVKSLLLPDSVLELIVEQGNVYLNARKQIETPFRSMGPYFSQITR